MPEAGDLRIGGATGTQFFDGHWWADLPPRADTLRAVEADFGVGPAPETWFPGPPETSGEEVRVTSSTGGEKGTKPSELFSAAPEGLRLLGEVCRMGSEKYALHNYRKGYEWSHSFNALYRHINAFVAGEDKDPESGISHMAHAMWHCGVLLQFEKDHPEFDDRYKNA